MFVEIPFSPANMQRARETEKFQFNTHQNSLQLHQNVAKHPIQWSLYFFLAFFSSYFQSSHNTRKQQTKWTQKNSHWIVTDSTHVCISCFRKCFERFCIFCAIHWCWCVLLRAPFSVCMRQKHFNCSMDARRLCVWYFLHYLAAAVRTYRMSLLCSVSTCCCVNCVRYTNTYVSMRVWVFVYSNVSMQWLTKLQSKPNVEYIQKSITTRTNDDSCFMFSFVFSFYTYRERYIASYLLRAFYVWLYLSQFSVVYV